MNEWWEQRWIVQIDDANENENGHGDDGYDVCREKWEILAAGDRLGAGNGEIFDHGHY